MTFAWALLIALAANPVAGDATPPADEGWRLVWSDEFDKDGPPDAERWGFETGFVRNRELQWYQPENARCENGLLVIEGRREQKPNPHYEAGSRDWRKSRRYAEYTSACLTTRGKHDWRYGRFEMRGRIDTRPGLWPAFWTLGVAGRWPDCGEIDVMEYYRGMLLANVAWPARDNPPGHRRRGHQVWEAWWDDRRKAIAEFPDPAWSSKFHVWRLDWDSRDIRIYVDGELLKHVQVKDTENPDGDSAFHRPHYLLLNLAIGGDHAGNPAQTKMPARFEADYVRVYQKNVPATTKPAKAPADPPENKQEP